MLKKISITAGGIAFILFGFLILLSQFESELGWEYGIIALFVLLSIGFAGLIFHGRVGRLGRVGLWVGLAASLSIGVLALLDGLLPELPWVIFMAAFFCIPLGLGAYGIAALRSKPLRWGNGLPLLAAASMIGILMQDPAWLVWISQLISLIMGLCWMALGYAVTISRATKEGSVAGSLLNSRRVLLGGLGLLVLALGTQAIVLRADTIQNTCPAPNMELTRLATAPRPVILDIDAAHEDMNAALFLLQHPGFEVKAITVAGTGEAHCEAGVRNTRNLLALHGRPDLPVACGSDTPMVGSQTFPAEWRAGADELYGLRLPENTSPSTNQPAPDLIASIIKETPEKVRLIAVGPLTNLGQVLVSEPSLADGIESVFIMGGAVELGGNVGMSGVGINNPVAEWNIFIDPRAANIVFAAGIPVTLVPLNATRYAPVTSDFYRCIQENRQTPEADFVYDILGANYDLVESGGFQFWDTLTAAILADESLASFEMMDLLVVEQEGSSLGQTRPDPAGHPVRVAVSAERDRFESTLLAVLNLDN